MYVKRLNNVLFLRNNIYAFSIHASSFHTSFWCESLVHCVPKRGLHEVLKLEILHKTHGFDEVLQKCAKPRQNREFRGGFTVSKPRTNLGWVCSESIF